MKDTKIEILESKTLSRVAGVVVLPENVIPIGTAEPGSVKVYIRQEVYKRIEKLAKEEMSKEVGSILLGEYIDGETEKSVIISDFIEAKYTDATAATLTFTHETWDYVYKEKEKKYPDKAIVGWQHTHPGYGIFLSSYDLFIQENFFNLPWQVAYVVDPIADTRGFFEWKQGKISKMDGFYVYDQAGKQITVLDKPKPVRKQTSVMTVILSFLLLVSVLVSVSFGMEWRNALNQVAVTSADIVAQAEHPDVQEETLPEDVVMFRVYAVQEGDCLENICAENGLDYRECVQQILKINGIKDVNKIYAGQELYLPINAELR